MEFPAATVEEVAEHLSFVEGRQVSIAEVRCIEVQALRKLRHVLRRRGITLADLLPGGE